MPRSSRGRAAVGERRLRSFVLLLNQHFETRQRILPLKTGEYFMNKAQEVGARTTLELYQKAATLDMGAPFRVEDGSIRVHARRAKSKEDKVNSRWVTQNLGRGSL